MALHDDLSLRVLAAGLSEDDQRLLSEVLGDLGGTLHSAHHRAGVIRFLSAYSIPVVIADRDLPDGGWKALLNQLARMNTPPKLIVTSVHADDRLWAEVLNLGGFDVLSRPFRTAELRRSIDLAWRHWKDERARLEQKIQLLALVAVG
jgi:DNA-binding NtrC family response regulator